MLGILSGAGDVTEGESPLREASCGWNDLSRWNLSQSNPIGATSDGLRSRSFC